MPDDEAAPTSADIDGPLSDEAIVALATPGVADPVIDESVPAPMSAADDPTVLPPDDAAVDATAGAAATSPRPEPRPGLYDGDTDVTKDELAALVRTTPPGAARPAPATGAAAAPATVGTPSPSADDSWGTGLEQLDDGGRSRWWIALGGFLVLAAMAALAFVAYLLFRVPTHEVPDLAGQNQERAQAAVADFEWEIEIERLRSDDEPDVGQVVRTSPEAGEDLAEGEPFLIVVSEGPELRVLPDLAGMSRGQAETELAELRLQATASEPQFSEDVADGDVISWSVPSDPSLVAGGEVLPDTEVAFVVSKGPEPRTLPDLVGLTVEEATAELTEARIEVNVSEAVFDNDLEAGAVVGANPAAGAVVERDSTVTITPSKGPDLVVLPDLTGQTLAQARETLTGAGLQVGGLLGNTSGAVVQTAVAGDIVEPGEEFLRNSAVDLALI